MSATQLRAWLGDEAGWDDRTTLRLATLYEQERALLEQNDLPPG